MATDGEINDALESAAALRLDPVKMIALCDRAMAEMMVDKAPKQYEILGKKVIFQTVDDIVKIRAYWVGKIGIVVQDAELSW